MMDANPEFSGDFEELQQPFDDATVLKKCFDCGNRIATAISYFGAGTIRTPQMCAISIYPLPSKTLAAAAHCV